MTSSPEFSICVPMHNESGNAEQLIDEIVAALAGRAFEMVITDDASTDDTRAVLAGLKAKYPELRVIAHRSNAGQSRALRTAIQHARAPIIGTLDGDGQNDPADLPALYRSLTRVDAPEGLTMVMGRRASRKDTAWKRFGSRFANTIRSRLLRDDCDDSGCGIKVMKREAFLALPYFDHMHRYMPALMNAEGYGVEFMDVNHRERGAGHSKYTNFGRLGDALSDLRGVMWLIRRRRNPGGSDEI
ncbi:MAG: glycosyltransferase family 2 protein [Henriciella sp.]